MRLRADRRAGLFLGGGLLLTVFAFAATVVLPSTDPALGEATDAARSFVALEQDGMAVYRSEGCWYCHTQHVRDAAADAHLGDPLTAADQPEDAPLLLGTTRVGPDLTNVGARYPDAQALIAMLRDPRAEGRHSSMPSYRYLSDDDLEALAAYLLSLR